MTTPTRPTIPARTRVLAVLIAGYWLYPHLLEDLAHRFVLRELSDKTETLLSAAAGLLGAPIIVPVYVNLLPIPTWAKVPIDCSVLGSATVSIVVWYRSMNPRTAHRLSALAVLTSPALSWTGVAVIYGAGNRPVGFAISSVAMVALVLWAVLTHRYPRPPTPRETTSDPH